MKLRKMLALVLALALLCATLTACGNDSGTSSTASGSTTSEAESGETASSGDQNMDNYINMEPTSLNTHAGLPTPRTSTCCAPCMRT